MKRHRKMQRQMRLVVASGAVASIMVGLLALEHTPPLSASAEYASSPVSFTRLTAGTEDTLVERVNYVLRSQDQLQTLWQLIGASSTPPTIDFTTQEVLAVFSDAGEKVSVATIKDAHDVDKRVVSVVVMKPESACTRVANLATYELVAVSAATLPLTHEDIVKPTSCPQ